MPPVTSKIQQAKKSKQDTYCSFSLQDGTKREGERKEESRLGETSNGNSSLQRLLVLLVICYGQLVSLQRQLPGLEDFRSRPLGAIAPSPAITMHPSPTVTLGHARLQEQAKFQVHEEDVGGFGLSEGCGKEGHCNEGPKSPLFNGPNTSHNCLLLM